LLQVRLAIPAIGTSSSDTRRKGHGRLPDIRAMSPEPWPQRHCRSSIGVVQNEGNHAPSRKRTSRYGSGGDASGDIEPARTTRRWHCPAPAIARAAPPLRERRGGRLPPQGLRPVSWSAFSWSSPELFQVSRRDRELTRFNGDGCAPFHRFLARNAFGGGHAELGFRRDPERHGSRRWKGLRPGTRLLFAFADARARFLSTPRRFLFIVMPQQMRDGCCVSCARSAKNARRNQRPSTFARSFRLTIRFSMPPSRRPVRVRMLSRCSCPGRAKREPGPRAGSIAALMSILLFALGPGSGPGHEAGGGQLQPSKISH